ncbi:MAG: hypothetical protein HY870_15895 [Chloroflexi bacterium]|nr:hypothetical protein [Chloroflexota bacterium]
METTLTPHDLLVRLYQNINTSANVIIRQCDALLTETNHSLNKDQREDIDIIRKKCQWLLWYVNEGNPVARVEMLPATEYEKFQNVITDLRTPLALIIGFSQVGLEEFCGPLTDKQKEIMRRIHELGEALRSILTDLMQRIGKE